MFELCGSVTLSVMRGCGCLRCAWPCRRGPLARRADEVPSRPAAFLMPCQVAESCCQVAGFTGMVVLSRNQVRCSGQEYLLSQEVGFRASVHRRLELLDAVHGAFDGTGVVVQGQPGDDGVQVAAQPGGERPQHWQVGVDGADLPVLRSFTAG